jgi:hypothetical protein
MIKQALLDNLKNLRGWRAPRKLVAFAVDDYCNVRVASPQARDRLAAAGLSLASSFDRLDAVETRQDLEALFEVLDGVRDAREQPAVFTAYAVSANPDFARMRADRSRYAFEPVSATFSRLAAEQPAAYDGAWDLWQEGRARKLIQPQFHGREHFNVELIERKLRSGAADLDANLEAGCMAALAGEPSMPGIGFTHAFAMHDGSSLAKHAAIVRSGLDLFAQMWGFRSESFTPPAHVLHPSLIDVAVAGGVQSVDKPLRCVRALGDGTSLREVNRSGRQSGQDHVTVVRNVVFEPGTERGYDPVTRGLQQVAAAFRWSRPAIISSHRVNYCGHLDEANRSRSLAALQRLLSGIVQRWPDAEFVSVDQLVRRMEGRA